MSAEVARLAKQLEKLQKDDFEDPERALDLLKLLKECKINFEILNTTRVGLIVNTLRKKTNSIEVAALGKKLIKNWKKFLPPDEPKRPKSAHRSSSPTQDMDMLSKESQEQELESTQEETPSSSFLPPAPRPSYPPAGPRRIFQPVRTGDGVRDKIVEMIVEAFKKNLPLELIYESTFYKLASEIEESIFMEFQDTNTKYKNRCRSRISNLKDNKNPILRQRVMSREIEPDAFAKMNAEEMASEQLKKKLEEYMEANINSAKMGVGSGTKTDLFKCWKCKGQCCSYFQLQTRSADEPMTTYVWCNDCGNRWKFC